MIRGHLLLAVAAAAIFASSLAAADPVMQIWKCKLNDGESPRAVKAVNDRWVAFVNAHVEGGGVSSATAASLVGTVAQIVFVDRYPDLAAWASTQEAMGSDEGRAIEAAFDEVSTCRSSSLYRVMDSN